MERVTAEQPQVAFLVRLAGSRATAPPVAQAGATNGPVGRQIAAPAEPVAAARAQPLPPAGPAEAVPAGRGPAPYPLYHVKVRTGVSLLHPQHLGRVDSTGARGMVQLRCAGRRRRRRRQHACGRQLPLAGGIYVASTRLQRCQLPDRQSLFKRPAQRSCKARQARWRPAGGPPSMTASPMVRAAAGGEGWA